MGEGKDGCCDAILALAALALLAFGFAFLAAGILILSSAGTPALAAGALLGGAMGLGFFGLMALITLLFVLLSAWYVIYAVLKSHVSRAQARKEKGGFRLERIKPSN